MGLCVIIVRLFGTNCDVVGPFDNDEEAYDWVRKHPSVTRGNWDLEPIRDPARYRRPRRSRRRRAIRLVTPR